MKFTLNWLKDHLQTTASLDQISQTLTAVGLEVEEISDPAEALAAFTVAEITEAAPHPDADRLQICKVNTGNETLQIVCGAPNARAGIKVALAKVGAWIPNGDFKIKKSKIRGVESVGMMCSARELNLGDEHDGIMELAPEAQLGSPIASVLGLDDAIIEIALTPNRGDCLGVRGIARDLVAAGLGELKALKPSAAFTSDKNVKAGVEVTLQDSGCTQFTHVTIRNVKNGQSPQWLQQRLKSIGLRPISALVDITNYMSVDLCRPLHAYDLDKLSGNIVVREGVAGEAYDGLNDKRITLQGGEIAIADDSGVIGLGGILGGESTACDENTSNIVLEIAWFDPIRIALAGRKLAIESDARYRFERSVNPEFLSEGAEIACAMIAEFCGGEFSEITHVGKAKSANQPIDFDSDSISSRLGLKVDKTKQANILSALGFIVKDDNVTAPSWRNDVEGVADLAEEVGRIIGYNEIPVVTLTKPAKRSHSLTPAQARSMGARTALAQSGLHETYLWSFISSELAPHFGGTNSALKLLNPISSELDQMRPSLLPHLIDAITRSEDRGLSHQHFFEVGLQFDGIAPNQQQLMASGVFAADYAKKSLYQPSRKTDIYDAKAAIEATITACGFNASRVQITAEAPDWYHPGKSGCYKLGKQVIAQFGEIHPRIAKRMDAPEGLIGFEIFLDAIPASKQKSASRAPLKLSAYQAVRRDYAFLADESLASGALINAIGKTDPQLIQQVDLFDIYRGKGLDENQKSVALSVTLQASDRTLTDKEIEALSDKIITNAQSLGAKLRA